MDYLYDENGMLYGFFYNGAKYFYIRDTMQNILGIIDSSGACVVQYNYSAYGECISVTGDMAGTVGEVNSFRYKGYYFDRETGFFYCKSRYYLPEWKRWLNSDSPAFLTKDIRSLNLLAYCTNDPCNNIDSSGQFPRLIWLITPVKVKAFIIATVVTAVVVAAVAATVNDIYQIASGEVRVSEEKTTEKNVQIENSYKIITPWIQWGYGIYVNHFNDKTRRVIKGSTVGVQYEWMLHNIAYYLGIGSKDSAASVDIGASIFSDDSHGIMSHAMRISYILLSPISRTIFDLIANGGY